MPHATSAAAHLRCARLQGSSVAAERKMDDVDVTARCRRSVLPTMIRTRPDWIATTTVSCRTQPPRKPPPCYGTPGTTTTIVRSGTACPTKGGGEPPPSQSIATVTSGAQVMKSLPPIVPVTPVTSSRRSVASWKPAPTWSVAEIGAAAERERRRRDVGDIARQRRRRVEGIVGGLVQVGPGPGAGVVGEDDGDRRLEPVLIEVHVGDELDRTAADGIVAGRRRHPSRRRRRCRCRPRWCRC